MARKLLPVVLLVLIAGSMYALFAFAPGLIADQPESDDDLYNNVVYDHPSVEIRLINDTVRLGERATFEVENTGNDTLSAGCHFEWKMQRRAGNDWQTVVTTRNNWLCLSVLEPGEIHIENVTFSDPEMGGYQDVQTALKPGQYRFVLLATIRQPALKFEVLPREENA